MVKCNKIWGLAAEISNRKNIERFVYDLSLLPTLFLTLLFDNFYM